MALSDPIPQLKRHLCDDILAVVGDWEQFVLARALGIDQPQVSQLQRGRLERFSVQKLIRMLARIDRRVDITVTNVGRIHQPRMFNFPTRPTRRAAEDSGKAE